MAFETLDIPRYILYALDFIFGVLSWGITADKLKRPLGCGLNKANSLGKQAPCNAVIALGVIAMLILLVIIVLRTLDLFEVITFGEIIETISFGVMTLIWFILAIVTIAVTDSAVRGNDLFGTEVQTAIAGAWIALFTHIGSTVVSVFAHRQYGK